MPHVVHLPGNDVLVDARVLKYMATTQRLGLRTTGLGVRRRSGDAFYQMGEARIVVAGVPETQRASTPARPASRAAVLRELARPGVASPSLLASLDDELARRSRTVRRLRTENGYGRLPRLAVGGARLVETKLLRSMLFRRATAHGVESTDHMDREQEIQHFLDHPELVPWREELPYVQEDEAAVGGWLDRLEPDLVHVHDVFMLGVAASYVQRAAASGRTVKLVYDAHEYLPGLATVPPRTIGAYVALEHEFVPVTDRVVTVSPLLAQWLHRDHRGTRAPEVVLNAPISITPPADFQDLRQLTGVAAGAPLLVYGGGIGRPRGIQTAVEALPQLPGVHVALVTNRPAGTATKALVAQARRLGVHDRFHVAPYVAPEHVTAYFASCSAGLSTLLRAPNHDAALTNKFCEYLLAGLPVVTSDTTAQAEAVRDLDLGAVYTAGDADDLARAIREVLDDLPRLQERIRGDDDLRHRYSWDGQVATIASMYGELLPDADLTVPSPGEVRLETPRATS